MWVNYEWGYSFIVPGLIIVGCGVLAYFFVVVRPEDVGLPSPDHSEEPLDNSAVTETSLVERVKMPGGENKSPKEIEIEINVTITEEKKPISMLDAVRIPGVLEFSLCLFFSKAVYYTFFFWLPVYIKDTSKGVDNHEAADLSAVFDGGGIIGGILAGAVSFLRAV